jgi:hypothetical protein
MIGWLIFGAYVVVGAARLKTYFRRVDAHNAKEYPYAYADNGMVTSTLWGAVALTVVWPFYEAQYRFHKWLLPKLTMTEQDRLLEEDKIIQQGIKILNDRSKRG